MTMICILTRNEHTRHQINKIPCRAVCNKLHVYPFPEDLIRIRWHENILIERRRLQFKKIAIMPKLQAPKLSLAVCNVSLDVVNSFPADGNGFVIIKLQRKLGYRDLILQFLN